MCKLVEGIEFLLVSVKGDISHAYSELQYNKPRPPKLWII